MENEHQLDELIEKTNLEYMLEFETQIFLDIIHNDGLVVCAKGINLNLVIQNLFKVYCDPGNLVLVLNSTEAEEKFFIDQLKENVHSSNYSTNSDERQDVYLSGGIHFITTRILVVDMLKKRIPIDKITGIVVLRAHQIFESCQEAFVLRLYRQANKTGFIKAFSNSVQSFTMGYGHVERVMRALFVKELFIWPRFHSLVIQSLKAHEPTVIELHIPISEITRKIQTYLLELMNLTVKELKSLNRNVEMPEITVENCLTKQFHKILQAQLDLVWHRLSGTSTQLIADLKTLRFLIVTLFYSDPVSFYSILLTHRTVEYAQKATWVLLQPAELLFSTASQLIYSGDKEFNPELCPKWSALLELLKVEIPHEISKCDNQKEQTILILCSNNRTCYQLNEILTAGPQAYLFFLALKKKIHFKSINKKFEYDQSAEDDQPSSSKKLKADDEEEVDDFKNSYLLTLTQTQPDKTVESNDTIMFEPLTQFENMDITKICETQTAPTILIQTFKGAENYVSLHKTLQDLKPSFVVMYHTNMTAVRELEMYEAHRRSAKPMKVFFLIHAETVEEQSYLTTLRREKEAFEFLIQTKSSMVIPHDQDGKSDQCLALQRNSTVEDQPKNTRQGGKVEEEVKQTIIVDMREFRSELPALIHKRGIEIEPVTITIGDYILTPEICIERKSLSDLIGSLNSGRLHQQCKQMSRFYTKPMLLIEFDQNKPFSWQNHYKLSSDGNSFDIQQKLLLLTLHFPKLKLIWSPSPYATAQLFEELKQGKEQPNAEYAASIGAEEDLDSIEIKYNSAVYDFVQKLPGITSKNIDAFLRNSGNMLKAIKKTEAELKDILGNDQGARALYSCFHEEQACEEEPTAKFKGKSKARLKFCNK